MRRLPITLALTATCIAASAAPAGAATFTPATHDFGPTPFGEASPPKTFTLTAVEPTLLTGPAVLDNSQRSQFSLVSEDCPDALLLTQTCTLTVTYRPVTQQPTTGKLVANGLFPDQDFATLKGSPAPESGAKKPKCKKGKKKGRAAAAAKKKKCKKGKRKK